MIDPDDLTPPPSALRRSSPRWPLVVLILLAVVGGAGFYFYTLARQAALDSLAAVVPPMDAGVPDAGGEGAVDLQGLPPLDQSDTRLQEEAAKVSSDPDFQRWLRTPGLVRRMTAGVFTMSDGESPRAALSFLAPSAALTVVERKGIATLSPQSYARYDTLGRVVESIDAGAAATVIRTVEPLCSVAWREIAPQGTSFRVGLKAALSWLADSNLPEGELRVVPKGAIWAFADSTLESRTALEKHLLRMGPQNGGKVKAKAQALRAALYPEATTDSAPTAPEGDAG